MDNKNIDLDAFDAIEDPVTLAPEQPSENSTLSLMAEAGEQQQRGPTIGQQATGLAIEAGGGVGGVWATQKVIKANRVAKGINYLKKIRYFGRAAVAANIGPQALEPVSTVGGLITFGVTEALWAAGSNLLKQEYFKGLGIQEDTEGGELLTSILLVSPLIKQGTRIPKLGQVFDPSMIKSRKWKVGAHVVQGATIGAVESSIRQTWDLMGDENADLGDFSFQDLAQGTVLGGGMGGVASLGGDGIKLVRAYRKVVARNKIEMRGSLVERLIKLDKAVVKAEKIGSARNRAVAQMHAARAKKELDELDAIHDSLDEELGNVEEGLLSQEKKPEVEAEVPEVSETPKDTPTVTEEQVNLADDWDARKVADGEEATPTNLEGIDVVEAPEASATTVTPKPDAEATPAPKTPEVSTEVAPEVDVPKTPMQKLREKYAETIADQDKGKGAHAVVELDANFREASDDFSKRVDAMIADTSPENVNSVSEIIDEYIELDALDADLRQKTGQMQHAHRKDAGDKKFTNEMSENRKTRQEALQGVRDKLDTLKGEGDADEFQKLVDKIFDEPVDAPKPKPSPPESFAPPKDGEAPVETPKNADTSEPVTAKEVSSKIEKLESELLKLQERFGDDSADLTPKQKKATEDKHKDIKSKIAFYKRSEKAALDLDKNQRELERLQKVIERADPEELEFEGFTKADLLKNGKAAGRLEDLKKNIAAQTKIIREMARPPVPKKTPRERAVARLQKRLDELRAIRSSTADELTTPAKPKRTKSAEEKDLEDRIKFYTGETKEIDDVLALNERIEVLGGLLRGESMAEIQAQIGLPPKLKPSYAKPKKIESELTKLKETEKRMMKMLRRRQTDELLSDLKDAFDPENGQRSPMDRLLNKYLEERTDALLNQPSTVTTGLPSGLIQTLWRPVVATTRSVIKAASPMDKDLKGL